MKSEFPSPQGFPEKDKNVAPPQSRFIDEKISDDHDTESTAANQALAPAGLKNPFWN